MSLYGYSIYLSAYVKKAIKGVGMSRRNSVRATRANKKRAVQRKNSLQYIAVGVILLVVVLAARLSIPRGTDGEEAGDAPTVTVMQYDAPPAMTIDENKEYYATVKMAKGGEFVIQLYPDKAPITVNSFVFLAREGYFDGTTFHRVLPNFMAQGGDPTGTGGGGPGYQFQNEDSDLTFDKAGVVAMANAGRDTNGSQFFITFAPVERLNGGYTIFGQVTEGMDVVNAITRRDPEQNPSFAGDAIQSVTITEE
jgi:cyclophilin family peptidyl-prolyl cis-trans isomerase